MDMSLCRRVLIDLDLLILFLFQWASWVLFQINALCRSLLSIYNNNLYFDHLFFIQNVNIPIVYYIEKLFVINHGKVPK